MIELPGNRSTRRALLGMAAVGAAGVVLGPSSALAGGRPNDEPAPGSHGDPSLDASSGDFTTLDSGACGSTVWPQSEINGQPTYYEVSGATATFKYNSTFYSRLEAWLQFYFNNTPVNWYWPGQIWSYGAYVNKNDGCTSYHNYGRAFDLSRIYMTDTNTGSLAKVFNARYDQWRSWTGDSLTTVRKRYWATCASINYHFKYVLHYLYNSDHWNHIHLDNAVSGSGNSTFTTGSSSQVYSVQACCRYIWGYSIAIDGIWGPETSGAVSKVLARIGLSGSITTQSNWLEFNRTSLRFGTGRQTY